MKQSVSGSLVTASSRTRAIIRRHLWLWPLLLAVALAAFGWGTHRRVERAIKGQLAASLQTLLDANVAALELWLQTREQAVSAIASSPVGSGLIRDQVEFASQGDVDAVELIRSPQLAEIREYLNSLLELLQYDGFVILDADRRVIAASRDDSIGRQAFPPWQEMLDTALAGQATVSRPFPSAIMLPDEAGNLRLGRPTMFAAAPVRDADGKIIAVLALRIRPEDDFKRILQLARAGESGETYAFDRDGLLVSRSRFDEQLKSLGLLPDREDYTSTMRVRILDPGVDLRRARPMTSRQEQPLTRMAASATAGNSGVDVDGYRDYRGVPVIGAWKWLPKYGFGVATEVDAEEAFRPLYVLRVTFWTLFGLLGASSVAALGAWLVNERLKVQARKAALEARRLGQYQLDEKIGEGGMGVVYRAHHALMQRPTAVKMLHPSETTEAAIARFEREVRLCSQLNHPNTIAIYDYGRTPENIFYYAMEYLDGIPLDRLVYKYGSQSPGRVIYILRQVCGSLSEAHNCGLIHRDIKPANIMINRRGGLFDLVKVLDFGLVKAVGDVAQVQLTKIGAVTGTPTFLSPEAIDHPEGVSARSDLYALGAVGYFLLTATPPFLGENIVELCMQHTQQPPEPPSRRLGHPLPPDLEAVILDCLAKPPGDRPASARELDRRLADCSETCLWGQREAAQWWAEHVPDQRLQSDVVLDRAVMSTVAEQLDTTTAFRR